MDILCDWNNNNRPFNIWDNPSCIKMSFINDINDIIQLLIVLLLVFNSIKTQTLSLFQMIVTAVGVIFGLITKYAFKE
jgi:uncharacterized membrane protein